MKASAAVKTVDLGEYRVNYASEGSGPHMMMLHGSDKREDWTVWKPLMSLSAKYSLVVPDLVGFGGSSRPVETPDYKVQARVLHEMMDRLGIDDAELVGTSWGGQVALELAMEWPGSVRGMILLSSTYDKSQLPGLKKLRKPTLIIWAEDDQIASLKAGYLLRDAIGTARLEVLRPVAKDPTLDFTIAHKLERYRESAVTSIITDFLSAPSEKIAEPPGLEPELRGMALKEDQEKKQG